MDIRLLINSLDNIEQNSSIKKYISEDLYSTPEMKPHWKRIDEGFIRGYEEYLSEVALTPDQIQNIFKQAGGGAGGEAPKDPGKLAALVDKVLPTSQAANLEKSLPEPTAGPVAGFEQKAGSAVQNLQGVDSGTKQSLMQLIKAGAQKPEAQQLILAGVSAVLGGLISKVGPIISMIPGGGPIAAAVTGAIVAGGVAVIAAKLRGEDWKSAFKGAIKPALMGGAAAVVGNLVTTTISTMMSGSTPAGPESGEFSADPALKKLNAQQQDTLSKLDPDKFTVQQGSNGLQIIDKATGELSGTIQAPSGVRPGDLYAALEKVNPGFAAGAPQSYSGQGAAGGSSRGNSGWNSMSQTNPDGTPYSVDQINQAKADLRTGNATNMANSIPAGATPTDDVGSYVQNKSTPGGGYSQTVRQNADPADPRVMASIQAKQDYYKNDPQGQAEYAKIMNAGGSKATFESSLYNKQATLKEWLRRDAQGLSTNSVQLYPYVVEGIMDFFKGKGKGAAPAAGGVTADALNTAWASAGSPTDSEEVAKVLQSAGVPPETVTKVFTDLKLPAPTGKIDPKIDPAAAPAPGADQAGQAASTGAQVNTQDLLAQILKLDSAQQQEVLAYLKK